MKKSIKQAILVSGVALVGALGIKNAVNRTSNRDVADNSVKTENTVSAEPIDTAQVKHQLEFTRGVLADIEQRLKSDDINPEERHELTITRANVLAEIDELTRQLSSAQIAAPGRER